MLPVHNFNGPLLHHGWFYIYLLKQKCLKYSHILLFQVSLSFNTIQDNAVSFFDFPELARNCTVPFLENIRFTHGLVMIFTKAVQFLLYHPTSKDFDRQSGFSLLRKMVVIIDDSITMGSDRGNIS